jgi:hypothetical protein
MKLFLLAAAAVLSGCATPLVQNFWGESTAPGMAYEMSIDALAARTQAQPRSYIIFPGNDDVELSDLQYQEYETYLVRALEIRGFEPAGNPEDAKIAVAFMYGIGEPVITERTYMRPIRGKTGIASSKTTADATSTERYGRRSVSYSETTTYTPSYGVIGYVPETKTTVSYIRHAIVIAYDLSEYLATGKEVELWRTVVQSEGPTDDLRRAMPVLIGAAAEHMATSTGKRLSVRMSENAPVVRAVRGEVTIDASQAINHAP